MRSKWSLIRPNCVRKHFWSDPSALEEVIIRPNCGRSRHWSDKSVLEEVMIRPKRARIRLRSDFSDQIDLRSDHLQTIVQTVVRSNFLPDPVISVGEHRGVGSTGSNHKPIWVWTSTWENLYEEQSNVEKIRKVYKEFQELTEQKRVRLHFYHGYKGSNLKIFSNKRYDFVLP